MNIKNTIVSNLKNAFATNDTIKPTSNIVDVLPQSEQIPSNTIKDPFSLGAFTANLKNDGFRITKGYYFKVTIFDGSINSIDNKLSFFCQKAMLPGWRVKTQKTKIYGLDYETSVELEQDPLWLTFNIDIMHEIEDWFLTNHKNRIFSQTDYSPLYKSDYTFNVLIEVTDENFVTVNTYSFNQCLMRTTQTINYGADDHSIKEISVEIVYETVDMKQNLTTRTTSKNNDATPIGETINPQTPSNAVNKNQLKVGPFTTDISLVNQVKDTITNLPKWFNDPKKL